MNHKICKICGGSSLEVFAHTASCVDCGVLLYFPYPPTDTELSQGTTLNWYRKSSFFNHDNFTRMLRFATNESDKSRELTILDYGGGGGQFALVCKSHFPLAAAYVTDISDESLLAQWKNSSIQILYRQFTGDGTKFDFIFLNDVFEHVSDPLDVLKQLTRKLKPKGRIFIDTPKQFWIYPVSRILSKRLYTKVLKGTVSKAHLQIWSKSAFELVIKQCGLRICKYVECSEYTMPADYYLQNMGITHSVTKVLGRLFYANARLLANNKILCVLSNS